MNKIKSLRAIEVLDSRDNPTLEVSCEFESGVLESASVPSGASTGKHEAKELRDGDPARYNGLGVLKAVHHINVEINDHLKNKEWDQKSLDAELIKLDGTPDKSRLGANAILGVSLAFARAGARERKMELYEYLGNISGNKNFKLPQPLLNVINGGKHAASGLDLQEFMIAPAKFPSFRRKIQAASEIIHFLKKIFEEKGYGIGIGDEGGFAGRLNSNEEPFFLIEEAIKGAGYSQEEVKIGIDAAASSFYKNDFYNLKIAGEKKHVKSEELINWYGDLINKHPIISIEDSLAEDDWEGFAEMKKKFGGKIAVVGDDLTVTNTKRMRIAKDKKAVNAVIIKLNQIGTLTETIEAVNFAKENGWATFISHRSGETTDAFIADLAVGVSAEYFKSGSLIRGERVAKYNRLMEIENIISSKQKTL